MKRASLLWAHADRPRRSHPTLPESSKFLSAFLPRGCQEVFTTPTRGCVIKRGTVAAHCHPARSRFFLRAVHA